MSFAPKKWRHISATSPPLLQQNTLWALIVTNTLWFFSDMVFHPGSMWWSFGELQCTDAWASTWIIKSEFLRASMDISIFFLIFNWRLITLQYCGGLCHKMTWICHGCTCVPHPEPPLPPPSPSPPSGSSQRIGPECPVSCIEPGLVICFTYDNTQVSGLFSQIIPPSPSPTESNSLFFTSVSLCCLA